MLSHRRIERLVERGEHERLLDEVLRNGRPLPLAARLRLFDAGAAGPAALALALQRHLELTPAATPLALDLAGRLLDAQDADGAIGSIVSTAAAVAGLTRLRETLAWSPVADAMLARRLDVAIDRALHALLAAQHRCAMARRPGMLGDEMETALALWQLATVDRARDALAWGDLARAADRLAADRACAEVLAAAEALAPAGIAA